VLGGPFNHLDIHGDPFVLGSGRVRRVEHDVVQALADDAECGQHGLDRVKGAADKVHDDFAERLLVLQPLLVHGRHHRGARLHHLLVQEDVLPLGPVGLEPAHQEGMDELIEPLLGRVGLADNFLNHEFVPYILDDPLDHLVVQALLVPEMVVHRRHVGPGLLADVPDRGLDKPLLREHLARRIDQPVPGVVYIGFFLHGMPLHPSLPRFKQLIETRT